MYSLKYHLYNSQFSHFFLQVIFTQKYSCIWGIKNKLKSDFQDENPITKTVHHLKIFERDGGR